MFISNVKIITTVAVTQVEYYTRHKRLSDHYNFIYKYRPTTNNAFYSNINGLKLYINVKGNWPVVDNT